MPDRLALAAARWRMEQVAAVTRFDLRKRVRWLSNIAFIAPMVGLLGTYVGVVSIDRLHPCFTTTFDIMLANLDLLLTPFAAGLAIGLPAFWAHRLLNRYAEHLDLEMERTSQSVLSYLELR